MSKLKAYPQVIQRRKAYSEDTNAQAANGARWSKNTATVYLEASDERFPPPI